MATIPPQRFYPQQDNQNAPVLSDFDPGTFEAFDTDVRKRTGIEMTPDQSAGYFNYVQRRGLTPGQVVDPNYVHLFLNRSPGGGENRKDFIGPSQVTGRNTVDGGMLPSEQASRESGVEIKAMEVKAMLANKQLAMQANPKSALDTLLDTSGDRMKAELNRAAARSTVDIATGRRGDKGTARAMADAGSVYSEQRNGDALDRLYSAVRGVKASAGHSWDKPSDRAPIGEVSAEDFAALAPILKQTPMGQGLLGQVETKLAQSSAAFTQAVSEAPPATAQGYIEAGKKAFGPLSGLAMASIIEAIPKTVFAEEAATRGEQRAEDRITARQDAIRTAQEAWEASGQADATGKVISGFDDDGSVKYRELTKEEKQDRYIKRLAGGFGPGKSFDFDNPTERQAAVKAGVITEQQGAMLEELSIDPVPLAVPDGEASASALLASDYQDVAKEAFALKAGGDDRTADAIIKETLATRGVEGSAAINDAVGQTWSQYKGLVEADAKKAQSSAQESLVRRAVDEDSAISKAAEAYVGTFGKPDNDTIKLTAQSIMADGITQGELDKEVASMVNQRLRVSEQTWESFKSLDWTAEQARAFPSLYSAVSATRSAIEGAINNVRLADNAEAMKKVDAVVEGIRSEDQAVLRAAVKLGLSTEQVASNVQQVAEEMVRFDKRTVKDGDGADARTVGVFWEQRQAEVAKQYLAGKTDGQKAEAIAKLREVYGYDEKTQMFGVNPDSNMARAFEAITMGSFDSLFEPATDPISGMGAPVDSRGFLFTKDAATDFARAYKASEDSVAGLSREEKDAAEPGGDKLPSNMEESPQKRRWVDAVKSGNKTEAQLAYVDLIGERYLKAQNEMRRVEVQADKSLVDAVGSKLIISQSNGSSVINRKAWNEVLRDAAEASGLSDPAYENAIAIQTSLSASASEWDTAYKEAASSGAVVPKMDNPYRSLLSEINRAVKFSQIEEVIPYA